jgi:hypothetical protein
MIYFVKKILHHTRTLKTLATFVLPLLIILRLRTQETLIKPLPPRTTVRIPQGDGRVQVYSDKNLRFPQDRDRHQESPDF